MKIRQGNRDASGNWNHKSEAVSLKSPLVLIFSNRFVLEQEAVFSEMRALFPDGHLVFGSTSGEITGTSVLNNGLSYTAIEFEKASFEIVTHSILKEDKKQF